MRIGKLSIVLIALLFAAALLLAQGIIIAPGFVPNTSGGSGSFTPICTQDTANFYTTASCTTTASAPAGSRVVVGIFTNTNCGDATSGVKTLTDSAGNTYAADTNTSTTTIFLCIFSSQLATALPSGDKITLTCATSGNCNEAFFGYVAQPSTGSVESANATANQSGCTSCTVTGSAAVTHVDWCYVAGESYSTGQTFGSWSNGFTTLHATLTVPSTDTVSDAYKQVSSGTPSTTVTSSVSRDFYGAVACYY